MKIPSINLRRQEPAYYQIGQALRESIKKGELSVGVKLPTVQQLAARYKTSVFTIQTARRYGTFVTGGTPKLRNVGLYFGSDFVRGREMDFYRDLNRYLSDELVERKIKYHLWIDGRPEDEYKEPFRDLVKAVERRKIQALIIGITNPSESVWLKKLGIPLVFHGSEETACKVGFSAESMMSIALGELKRMGCKTVGTILPNPHPKVEGTPKDYKDLFRHFTDHVSDQKLATRNAWVRVPDRFLKNDEFEKYGYQQFKELWSQQERPDGLLIYPDVLARGSIAAMLEMGISCPRDLKVVLHRNKGIPILCPLSASWLVTDTRQVANALINQAERAYAGEDVEPVMVNYSLERDHE